MRVGDGRDCFYKKMNVYGGFKVKRSFCILLKRRGLKIVGTFVQKGLEVVTTKCRSLYFSVVGASF